MKNIFILALTSGVVCAGGALSDEEHGHQKNKFEMSLSNTHTEHGENAATFALAYHRRVSPLVSVGILGEHSFGHLDTNIVGIPVKLYPNKGWVLTAMPGAEFHGGHHNPLFRVGVGYEFEMGGYSITPEVNADFVDGETNIVAGISIGFGF